MADFLVIHPFLRIRSACFGFHWQSAGERSVCVVAWQEAPNEIIGMPISADKTAESALQIALIRLEFGNSSDRQLTVRFAKRSSLLICEHKLGASILYLAVSRQHSKSLSSSGST